MSKVLMLRSSDGKVMVAPTWDKRPSATQSLPLETGVHSRALERVIQCWTKHALAEASGESRESLARWDADFARRLEKDGLTKEFAAAVRHLRLDGVPHGERRIRSDQFSIPRQEPRTSIPRLASFPATAMSKVLMLRSSDGKVMVAPTWDKRPSATQSLPLETGVHSRALERIIQCWTKHALAEASGESRESLARWDADFARRLEKDGLAKEFAAAVRHLRLDGVRHGERRPVASNAARPRAPTPSDVAAAARADLAVAWCAAGADPTTALRAAGADPVDAWCAVHADVNPVVLPDGAAASRACGRQRAEEEEYACHHRKHPTAMSRPLALKACSFFRSAPGVKKVTASAQLHPSKPTASSLRARRGLPELSCKCPQQNPLRATSKKQPA